MSSDLDVLERRLREVYPEPEDLTEPPGYGHSSLALIDSVFSIGARYGSVRNVVRAYRESVGVGDAPFTNERSDSFAEHGLEALLDDCGDLWGVELANALFSGNTQQTAGRLKADVVVDVAERLRNVGIDRQADLSDGDALVAGRSAWTGTHGLGKATWQYFLSLCGHQEVKPDRMIIGWVSGCLGREVDACTAASYVERLADRLDASRRALDHAIWRHQSGRGMDGL